MDVWRLERPTQPANSRWKAQLLNVNMANLKMIIPSLDEWLWDGPLSAWGCSPWSNVAHLWRWRTRILCRIRWGNFNRLTQIIVQILTFNLNTRKFELLKTHPDPVFGIPRGRKCHALVQQGTEIYIIGGCRDVQNGRVNISKKNLKIMFWFRVAPSIKL